MGIQWAGQRTRISSPIPARSARLPALDGLRGLAIALVSARHAFGSIHSAPGLLALLGWVGVDLFFVLSGFLITGILLESAGRPGYYRRFFTRRVLRIFPLYYAYLALAVLVPWSPSVAGWLGQPFLRSHLISYATHTSNWLIAAPELYHGSLLAGVSSIWSLAVEEQFYLIWPVVVAMCAPRRFVWICVGLLLAGLLVRLGLAGSGAAVTAPYVLTPARLDPLLIGALIALLVRSSRAWLARLAAPATGVGAVGFAAFVWVTRSPAPTDAWTFAWLVPVVAIGWGGVLLYTLGDRPTAWGYAMRLPALRWLGRYSYAIYLLQLPVIRVLAGVGVGADRLGILAGGTLAMAVTCAAAFASWHLWEKHWLALTGGPPRRAAELVPVP